MRRQGSQFTSTDFIKVLAGREIKISMDGKGAWRDNVFVERLWRTIKYEEVYLRAYASVSEARASLGRYLAFYNSRRPHSNRRENPRSGLLHPAVAGSGRSIIRAGIHLRNARNLFKQTEPPLSLSAKPNAIICATSSWRPASCTRLGA